MCRSRTSLTMYFLNAFVVLAAFFPPSYSLEADTASSNGRIKRRSSYDPWSSNRNQVSIYEASNTYRASPYRVPRPYFIPVYGSPGRLIFYPPQPLYTNPGIPKDNPLLHFQSEDAYLPPKESPHFQGDKYLPPKETPETTTSMDLPNRGDFPTVDEDDPNAPIWGDGGVGGGNGMVQMPLSGDNKVPAIVPTRVPNVDRPPPPPLIHEVPSAASRPPALSQTSDILRTTTPPSLPGPSNCVWAIISCCSASEPDLLPQNCFEQRGCPGPFWGASPCASDYARAAIQAAVNYYNTGK